MLCLVCHSYCFVCLDLQYPSTLCTIEYNGIEKNKSPINPVRHTGSTCWVMYYIGMVPVYVIKDLFDLCLFFCLIDLQNSLQYDSALICRKRTGK